MKNIDRIRNIEGKRQKVRKVIYDADERVMEELCSHCDKSEKGCLRSVARLKVEKNDCVDGLMRWMMEESEK